MVDNKRFSGVGLTSERSRNRLLDQLRELGIKNEEVLWAISTVPRHIFLPQALASRA